MTICKGNIRPPRKMWGNINPRKSLKGNRKSSREARPRTAGGCGIKINKGLGSKLNGEDPILALLREDDGMDDEVSQDPPLKSITDNLESE